MLIYPPEYRDATGGPREEQVGSTSSLFPWGEPLLNGIRVFEPAELKMSWPRSSVREKVTRLSLMDSDLENFDSLTDLMSQTVPLYASLAAVPGPSSIALADRKLISGLYQVRHKFAGLGHRSEESAGYKIEQKVSEYEQSTVTRGWVFQREEVLREYSTSGQHVVSQGSISGLPQRAALAVDYGNDGLSRPGAGAELVDFVESSRLTPETLDRLKASAQKVLAEAEGRLIGNGAKSPSDRTPYEKLANLHRAMEMAEQKWGRNRGYGPELPGRIEQLGETTGLYALATSDERRGGNARQSLLRKTLLPSLHELQVMVNDLEIDRAGHLALPERDRL